MRHLTYVPVRYNRFCRFAAEIRMPQTRWKVFGPTRGPSAGTYAANSRMAAHHHEAWLKDQGSHPMRSLFFLLVTALMTIAPNALLRAAEARASHARASVSFAGSLTCTSLPDGSSAICVVSEVNGPTIESHLWLADLNNGKLGQFTFSQKNERLPQWAPGRHLGSFQTAPDPRRCMSCRAPGVKPGR